MGVVNSNQMSNNMNIKVSYPKRIQLRSATLAYAA